MFDLVFTAAITAGAAVVVFYLSAMLSETGRQRVLVAALFGAWFSFVLAAGATRLFFAPSAIGAPVMGLLVVVPAVLLSVLVLGTERGRKLVNRTSLAGLVGIHSMRVLGISFVLLYWAKRLPAPFAPAAGWGDVATGVLAIPLALLLARSGSATPKSAVLLWNVFGLADLVNAVAMGATSSPGPLQIFHAQPTTAIMPTVPWILIPCFIVPGLMFLHLCTFYKLRSVAVQHTGERNLRMRIAATDVS
jgi:hypothetical protein